METRWYASLSWNVGWITVLLLQRRLGHTIPKRLMRYERRSSNVCAILLLRMVFEPRGQFDRDMAKDRITTIMVTTMVTLDLIITNAVAQHLTAKKGIHDILRERHRIHNHPVLPRRFRRLLVQLCQPPTFWTITSILMILPRCPPRLGLPLFLPSCHERIRECPR